MSSVRPSRSAHYEEVQRLKEQLDAANRKTDDYAHLFVSLYAELKQYRDIICASCREKVLLAATRSPQQSALSPSRDTVNTLGSLSGHTDIIATHSDTELPIHPSANPLLRLHYPRTIMNQTPQRRAVRLTPTTHFIPSLSLSRTLQTSLPTFHYTPTFLAPVEYNPELKQTLDLSVASTFAVPAGVESVAFSRDGRYFAVGLRNEETHVFDMTTMLKSVLVDHGTSVIYSEAAAEAVAASKRLRTIWAVRFSPDTKSIATAGTGGQIKIWEINRKRLRTVFKGYFERIDFSPDGRFLVSGSFNGGIRMWRIRDGSSTSLSQPNGDLLFRPVMFSPDGRCVVAGNSGDGHLEIWKARTGRLLKDWQAHPDVVSSLAYQPDGKRIASGSGRIWKSWNVSSLQGQLQSSEHMVNDEVEKEVLECKGHEARITSISISPDSRWVLTSSWDCSSRIWNATTGMWMCTLTEHNSRVWASDFSPTGHYLVTGDHDRVVLWRYHEADE